MTEIIEEEKNRRISESYKARKEVKELLKFEFEVIAIVGLIISLSGVSFSSLEITVLVNIIIVAFYYVIFILIFIFRLLYDYMIEKGTITSARVDFGFKLVFLQIIISFALIPFIFGLSIIWINIVTAILILFLIMTFIPLNILILRRKNKEMIELNQKKEKQTGKPKEASQKKISGNVKS